MTFRYNPTFSQITLNPRIGLDDVHDGKLLLDWRLFHTEQYCQYIVVKAVHVYVRVSYICDNMCIWLNMYKSYENNMALGKQSNTYV